MPIAERFAAIDTQVLYGDSCNIPHHRIAVKFLREQLGFEFVIVPSVMLEIFVAQDKGSAELKKRTHLVLQDIADSNYIVHRALRDTYERSIRLHAEELLTRKILPKGKKQAARVVIEAAYFDCTELLTTRASLLDAATGKLNAALAGCGLRPVRVLSPKHFTSS